MRELLPPHSPKEPKKPKIWRYLIALAILLIILFILSLKSNGFEIKNEVQEIQAPEGIEAIEITLEMYKLIDCESKWDDDVYGDEGQAYSLAQFHKPTFEWLCKLSNEQLDYYDPYDQIELLKWALENDFGFLWTCYQRYNN